MCLLVSMLLLLVFFTLFGEGIYAWGKPKVTTARATSYVGLEGVVIPFGALRSDDFGDYVYLLLSERGYSRVIYTVTRANVEVIDFDVLGERATLVSHGGVSAGDRLVMHADGMLEDGCRVVLVMD